MLFNIQKMKIMASSPFTSWQIDGKTMETVADFIFLGSKSLQVVNAALKFKDVCSLKKSYDKPTQHIKNQRYHFATKSASQCYDFSSSHVQCERSFIKKAEHQRTDAFNCGAEDS